MSKPDKTLDRFWDMPQRDLLALLPATPAGLTSAEAKQRLRAVDFTYPLIPALYILVGATMMIYGVIWQPKASLLALATVGAGALVYHFKAGVRRV